MYGSSLKSMCPDSLPMYASSLSVNRTGSNCGLRMSTRSSRPTSLCSEEFEDCAAEDMDGARSGWLESTLGLTD